MDTYTILLIITTSLGITAALTYIFIPLIKKWGLVDDPALHKHPAMIHTKIIPRAGGLPIFIGIFISCLIFLPITKITIGILVASFLALVMGLIDDRYNARSKDVSPYLRFGFNILCASIVVFSGISIPFITHPLGGILHLDMLIPLLPISFGQVIALIWIVWVMNMLNWSKGIDGQMPGIVAISAFVIGILSLRTPLMDGAGLIDARLSFVLTGAALGFLVFNFHPAKIFPGYGATCMYLLLAVVSILSSAKLATAILVMGVPTMDALFTIFRRVLSKRSPFRHDDKHLHHILLKFGFGQRKIALFYWIISAIFGTIALSLRSESKPFALISLGVIAGGGLLFLHFIVRYRHEKDSA